jgi:hypothetical protein
MNKGHVQHFNEFKQQVLLLSSKQYHRRGATERVNPNSFH